MLEFGMKKCRARETFEGAKREVESIVLLLQYCSNEGMGKVAFPHPGLFARLFLLSAVIFIMAVIFILTTVLQSLCHVL